jgi:cardiolipin synthase
VQLQTLSLEGDRAGIGLGAALLSCGASDRRLSVDSFTRYVLSGRWVHSPAGLLDARVRAEARRTRALFRRLRAGGVGVRWSSPAGPLLLRLPARNHKKSVVIDDRIAYIGGFNFSDHNFAWHDLMLRMEDPAVATFLAEDLDATWHGRAERRYGEFDGIELHILDGRSNAIAFDRIFQLVASARREIVIHSPYLTFPFCDHLRRSRKRGVDITLISPDVNTVGGMRRYILWESARSGFDVRFFPRMTHVKAMLIDDRWLILGSSNFDYLSFRAHQEIVAIVRDRPTIDSFRAMLDGDLLLCHKRNSEFRQGDNGADGCAEFDKLVTLPC